MCVHALYMSNTSFSKTDWASSISCWLDTYEAHVCVVCGEHDSVIIPVLLVSYHKRGSREPIMLLRTATPCASGSDYAADLQTKQPV